MAAVDLDVRYVAHLARIELTDAEVLEFDSQLGGILSYIGKLKELNVDSVEPMAHAVPRVNVTRSDEVQSSLTNEEALLNAPAKSNGLFSVPKIVE
ncbi:MAG: Asp-tRNA(Asn)/Glu-tRNA(Gln) amidotransferase subunit GatC [Verrucomicrobia bacterium]|nr:Asp-tRNA(Asn)/Glu-tRNA(Gln) amidotransferase subunit GatC [Verrucomicrobiota bacterium]